MTKTSNNLLRDFHLDMWLQHNLKVSFRRNTPLCGELSHSLRSVRLALEPLAAVLGGFQRVSY